MLDPVVVVCVFELITHHRTCWWLGFFCGFFEDSLLVLCEKNCLVAKCRG